MTGWLVVLVAVAGGVGAATRFAVDGAIRARSAAALPVGTIMINLSGSFLLGLITGLALTHTVSEPLRSVIGTGFLGGYTTFSTASFETVRLVQDRRFGRAMINGLGTLVGATLLALVGFTVGSAG